MPRMKWTNYFLTIALIVKDRSTCKKRKIGAVFTTHDNHILTTGYNGSISGDKHCIDSECDLNFENKCIRTIHAEINGIAQAAKLGIQLKDSNLYVTREPCVNCFKLIAQAGIKQIFFISSTATRLYNTTMAKKLNIEYMKINQS